MQLRFTYTFEDFKQLSLGLARRYWYGKLPVRAWLAIGILAAIAAAAVTLWAPRGTTLHTWGALPLFVVTGAVIGGLAGLRFQIRSYFRKQKLDGVEITYDVSDSGIRARSSQYDTLMQWDGCEAATSAPGYRFVWLNKLQGMVFPDRCFESEAQKIEFERLVQSKLGSKAELS
jgi:hypothetical protein